MEPAGRTRLIRQEAGELGEAEQPAGAVSIPGAAGRYSPRKGPPGAERRGEEMFAPITDGLLGGLLSGLELQAEMSDLLEEIYYQSLR